ncbi:MAG: MATE family efflux transporter [Ectothiorhodospiraceae bacterium]|nr:MATE family efflux transporter [Chromatiales bacterium]MCP5153645.1 MATE family efflux transporter [Ectothiorhodospiraceae bacterium]
MTLTRHLRETVALAAPVMVGRMSILALVVEDTLMTGRHGVQDLAWYGLAASPQVPLFLLGLGLLMGTVVLTAQAYGAGRTEECGAVLRSGLVHALAAGVVLALVCQVGEPLLLALGQTPVLAAGAGRVLGVLGLGIPGALLFATCTFFLEGIGRPLPATVIMLGANVLNIGLNWVLVYGNLGAPAMGAEGAAAATTIVRWCTFAAVGAYIALRVDATRFGLRRAPGAPPSGLGARLRRIGLPTSLAHGLESGAFAAMTIIAGWLGTRHVAAYQVAVNLLSTGFMIAVGCGTAASVRVGHAVGRGEARGARVAGWVALGLGLGTMALVALGFALLPRELAGLYVDDPVVLALTAATLVVASMALVADGAHGVLIGALRGMADVWPATLVYMVSFWAVMVPLGYWLSVRADMGAPGLMGGVLGGALVAALALAVRFDRVARRIAPTT